MKRVPFLCYITADQKCGKSTLLKKIIQEKQDKELFIIIAPDDSEPLFKGVIEVDLKKVKSLKGVRGVLKRIYEEGDFELLYNLFKEEKLSNCTLICDDPIFLQHENKMPDKFKNILQRLRQYQCDVICTSHAIDQIKNYMFDYLRYIYLGKTSGQIHNRKGKLGHLYNKIFEAKKKADENYKKNPYGFILIDIKNS